MLVDPIPRPYQHTDGFGENEANRVFSKKMSARLEEEADPPKRSTSAPPPSLTLSEGDQISPDDVRLTPAYFNYYYSHKPIDHRLPKPLIDWSKKQQERNIDECSPMNTNQKSPATSNGSNRGPATQLLRTPHDRRQSSAVAKIQTDFPRTPSPVFTGKRSGSDPIPPQTRREQSPFSPTRAEQKALSAAKKSSTNLIDADAARTAELEQQARAHIEATLRIQQELQDHVKKVGATSRSRSGSNPSPHSSVESTAGSVNIPPPTDPAIQLIQKQIDAIKFNEIPYSPPLGPMTSIPDVPHSPTSAPGSAQFWNTPEVVTRKSLSTSAGGAFWQMPDPYSTAQPPMSPYAGAYPSSPYWGDRGQAGAYHNHPRMSFDGPTAGAYTLGSPLSFGPSVPPLSPHGVLEHRLPIPAMMLDSPHGENQILTPGSSLSQPGFFGSPTGQGDPQRSAMLSELKLNKSNNTLTLMDVVKRDLVVELAMDQNGSRFIQQRLEGASHEEKQAVFAQILPHTLQLCTDVFGNYVIQKYFEYGLQDHKRQLAEKLIGNVLPLTLQMYGCRVIQKALEAVDERLQTQLVMELTGHVLECVKDQNGNHVIQKCIEKVPPQHITFIVNAFANQVHQLSAHPYGCRVIQRLLEHCRSEQKAPILDEIANYALDLIRDQYGNYVVQHVLQRGAPKYKTIIVDSVLGNVLSLSKHKFASNVAEQCFVHGNDEQKEKLVLEICGQGENSPLAAMVRDQYANYVVQKVLGVVNESQRMRLIHRITQVVPNIRKIAYGKHIVARIEKLTGKPL